VQIPGYLEKVDELKAEGIDEVIVYCVNDGAVMKAWAENQGTEKAGGLITLMGDPTGDLTKALNVELKHPGPESVGLFGRSKRFAAYIVDGVIKSFNLSEREDDPAGDEYPETSCAPAMLDAIRGLKTKSEL
jgi:peroxiredoxin